jgi:hypothetical protein
MALLQGRTDLEAYRFLICRTASKYRTWLDANKIQPAYFKSIYINGVIGFERLVFEMSRSQAVR